MYNPGDAAEKLRHLTERLSKLHQISDMMLSTLSESGILPIILTAVTAGQHLGLNRAFLLLVDEKENVLKGEMAVGPSDPGEAYKIWSELDEKHLSLQEIIDGYKNLPGERNSKVNQLVLQINVPLTDKGILSRSILERRSFKSVGRDSCSEADQSVMNLLNVPSLTVVPLVTRNKAMGALLVDNFITKRELTEEDIEFLGIYANQAALAIVNAHLYESLQQKVRDLQEAYENLNRSKQQLIEAEKFAAMGKMAALITHEIKNPLVSIGGFARFMYRQLDKNDPKEADKVSSLQIIINETTRLENILKNILSFARQPHPQFELCNLNDIVFDTIQIISQEISEKQVKLEMKLEELSLIQADRELLGQVFLNIYKNALQAMPQGGKLITQTLKKGDFVQVTISDTGVGIPKEHLDSLFDPFFTTKSSGTGLGLCISKQVIVAHGGFIEVSSAEGKGSTFTINLPGEAKTDEEMRL